ncbi:hypothetical protein [Lentzea cavernae]|uniref:Uncharacterized protein n=1 Tax=Lentzea cavernae TaxID=2020703 RepID=A0ABQ3MR57_9PSEU|nr:hypothetical protein [Lentzea cavernae]GHH57747.1 hypothetical protein GCM10017774_77900 [Lentzea cavernae]
MGARPAAVAVNLRRLRNARTAILILLAFALIVAGLWTIAAALFGAVIGAGVGLFFMGVALLVVEGLSSGPGDR